MRTLAVFSILVFAQICGCTSDKDDQAVDRKESGSMSLALEVGDGSNIDTVHYSIEPARQPHYEGDIDVSNLGAEIGAYIGGIKEGGPYTITLTATTSE